MAGIRPRGPTDFAHDCVLKRRNLELDWIRNLMRFAGRRVDGTAPASPERGTEVAMESWVGIEATGQTGYYARKAREFHVKSVWTEHIGMTSFASGLLSAMALLPAWEQFTPRWSSICIAFMGLLPYVAAVRQSYAQRVSESELVNQYGYMERLYRNPQALLRNATALGDRQDILRALGEAAFDENALWLCAIASVR